MEAVLIIAWVLFRDGYIGTRPLPALSTVYFHSENTISSSTTHS